MSRGLSCEGNHEKKMIFLEKILVRKFAYKENFTYLCDVQIT